MGVIVVVGGGFAGVNAALAARRVADDRAEVLMISREPRLTIRPRLYEAKPEELTADLSKTFEKVNIGFCAGEAIGFDAMAKSIFLMDQPALKYDRLVIAAGSVMERPQIAGSHLPFSIDDLNSAILFDDRLRVISTNRCPTVVIVGAGFTGVELALEMRDRLAAHAGETAGENARIVLVDRQPVAGAELGESVRGAIEQALRNAGVEMRLNCKIAEMSSRSISFTEGLSISADAVVLCTGLIASPLTRELPVPKDDRGRLIADEFLRLPALPAIFAAGDAVRAEPDKGRTTLFSCQHSLQSGKFAGENAALDLLGLPLRPYRQERYVTCLDLGRSGAVFTQGWNRDIQLTGQEAKAVKRRINTRLIYPTEGSSKEILAASQIDPQRGP